MCCHTGTIEIYELSHVKTLYLKADVIIGELQTPQRCGQSKFQIDTPANGDISTKDIFFVLKEAWNIARHSIGGEDLHNAFSMESDDEGDHSSLIRRTSAAGNLA